MLALSFCDLLALEIHRLGRLSELEGTGGSVILYLGYVEVNLQIPVMVRSKIIDWVMRMMTKGELVRAIATWRHSLWYSYVWVTPVAQHNFKGRWRRRQGGHPLPKL